MKVIYLKKKYYLRKWMDENYNNTWIIQDIMNDKRVV